MTPAGQPAASRPPADHREPHTTPTAHGVFAAFLQEAEKRRAQDENQRARARESGSARAQDWADPDPAALGALDAGRHPVDRAIQRSKQGRTRQKFVDVLRVCTAILTAQEPRAISLADVFAYPWHHLTVDDAADFRDTVYRRYATQSTRNDRMCTVRRMVDECYRARLISALRRDLLREQLYTQAVGETTRRRRLTPEEITSLLQAADRLADPCARARNLAIVALFRTSGIRVCELVRIALSDWDRNDDSILLRDTKNGRAHRVVLHPGAILYLEGWLELRGEANGALFTALNRPGTSALSEDGVRDMLGRLARSAGVARFGCHDFRRTFATDLLEKHDPLLVSRLLNHRKPESTMVYDLRGERAQRDAVASLDLIPPGDHPRPGTVPGGHPGVAA